VYGGLSITNAVVKINAAGCTGVGTDFIGRNARLTTIVNNTDRAKGLHGWGSHFMIS